MKLALVISSLRRGGAEGVLARIANGLAARGHAITLVTLSAARPELPLDKAVAWVTLDAAAPSSGSLQALVRNAARLLALRRSLMRLKPDAVLSFMDTTNVLTLLAVGLSLPVIVSERVHPELHDTGPAWRFLRGLTYPWSRLIVVQTRAACRSLPERLRAKTRVIPNAVAAPAVPAGASGRPGGLLVAMGRLERQKGFDLLLRAFAAVENRAGWKLVIHGEGSERPALEALREELGLRDEVDLPGRTEEPQAALSAGDLFVLSSRFEGVPNALTEAMACGLPAVAFDCPCGPADILRDGLDGILVPPGDIPGLALALQHLMADQALRREYGANARSVVFRFSEATVMDLWEDAFRSASSGAPRQGGRPCAA